MQLESMASQNSLETPDAWETYVTSSPLANRTLLPTDQLLHQSQAWQSGPSQREQINKVDPELFSENDMAYVIETGGESGGIAEEVFEDMEEEEIVEHVTSPVTSHRLPLPPDDFQPFRGENLLPVGENPLDLDQALEYVYLKDVRIQAPTQDMGKIAQAQLQILVFQWKIDETFLRSKLPYPTHVRPADRNDHRVRVDDDFHCIKEYN